MTGNFGPNDPLVRRFLATVKQLDEADREEIEAKSPYLISLHRAWQDVFLTLAPGEVAAAFLSVYPDQMLPGTRPEEDARLALLTDSNGAPLRAALQAACAPEVAGWDAARYAAAALALRGYIPSKVFNELYGSFALHIPVNSIQTEKTLPAKQGSEPAVRRIAPQRSTKGHRTPPPRAIMPPPRPPFEEARRVGQYTAQGTPPLEKK